LRCGASCPDNISNLFEAGNTNRTEGAFAQAAHSVKGAATSSAGSMRISWEPGGAGCDRRVGTRGEDRFNPLRPMCKPHRVTSGRSPLVFSKIRKARFRVIAGDVGVGRVGNQKGWQYFRSIGWWC